MKEALAQQFDWMDQNKTTQSYIDTRDNQRKDLSTLVGEMGKANPALAIPITQGVPSMAYDYTTNTYSIPFALFNGDIKQAFLDFFKIQAGGTGAVVTVPIVQKRVINWTIMAVEQDIANIIGKPLNDPSNAFMDYRPDSPAANLDLAGQDVLAAMHIVASQYHTNKDESNEGTRNACLTTGFSPTHWSDIQLHYYCILGEPRSCYTFSTSGGKPRVDS